MPLGRKTKGNLSLSERNELMPTPIDSLKPGQYVAMSGFKHETRRPTSWEGFPCKILAISLPFLACSFGCKRFSIDTRFEVQRVSRHYAQQFEDSCGEAVPVKREPKIRKAGPGCDGVPANET